MNDTIVKTENGFYVIPEKVIELKRAEQILKNQNEWLWDNTSLIPQPMTHPKELGIAIDVVVEHLEEKSNRWIPFIGNEKKYNRNRICPGMIEIKFDTMETCDYEDDWPIAIMTHFREKI